MPATGTVPYGSLMPLSAITIFSFQNTEKLLYGHNTTLYITKRSLLVELSLQYVQVGWKWKV
jgi:hypothetical protein